MSDKITVYTCLVGDYDAIVSPRMHDPRLRFVCFTDNRQRNVRGWEFRELRSPEEIRSPALINRYHKILPHELGLPHAWSVYIDANIGVMGRLSELVDRAASHQALIACPRHPQRCTVREEIDACVRLNKFEAADRALAEKRLEAYLEEGMPPDATLTANYLLIRAHGDNRLQEAMHTWWCEVRDSVRRDQLSLPYALWKHGISPQLLQENANHRNGYFYRYPHAHSVSGVRGWLYRNLPMLSQARVRRR